jgi:hypothetical protein
MNKKQLNQTHFELEVAALMTIGEVRHLIEKYVKTL